MLKKVVIAVLLVVVTYGFLLEPNTPNVSGGITIPNSQFLSLSEFYEYQKRAEQKAEASEAQTEHVRLETVNLRHDMDKTLALLASQMQQKLTDFQNHLSSQCQCNGYNQLLDKYNKLEQKLEALLAKYTIQEQELSNIRNITLAVEQCTETMKNRALEQDAKLHVMQNKTQELEEKISDFQEFNIIQHIIDVRNLQQKVDLLSLQTHDLSMTERARTEDFLALYNSTKETENNIQTLEREIDEKIESAGRNANTSIEAKAYELKRGLNTTLFQIQQQITRNSEEVALTSCSSIPDSQNLTSGTIIKFNDLVTYVGITNIVEFQNSGKFITEKPGIYQISVYIGTVSNESEYKIFKNYSLLSRHYDKINGWHATISVAAALLQSGDMVWVQTSATMTLNDAKASCITILKIR